MNKRHILLSVTGMSPAVVTETLYALITEKGIIPEKIHVITTLQGKNKLLASLLGIEGGKKKSIGALEEFIIDYGEKYGIKNIHFDEKCIEVLKDQNGKPLSDIRTPEENQIASDQIVARVAKYCDDKESALHVSIAGGRKTMGFFLGYALSLYGREQDSLSHVLVSEPYENVPNFYYPKPHKTLLNDQNGREIDAQNAKIMLAEIPWVRLSLCIPTALKNKKIGYSEAIARIQSLLLPSNITFLNPEKNYKLGDYPVKISDRIIEFSPREYTYLLSICLYKLADQSYIYDKKIDNKQLISVIKRIQNAFCMPENDTPLQSLIRDSRTGLRKKLQNTFGIDKESPLLNPYLPREPQKRSKHATHELTINKNNINIDEIKPILKKATLIDKKDNIIL